MTCNYQLTAVKCLGGKKAQCALFLLLFGTWFTMAPDAAGQTPLGCNTGWGTVSRMTGTFQVTGTGSMTFTGNGGMTTVTINQSISGSLDMPATGVTIPGGGTCYFGIWSGSVAELINIDDISVSNIGTGAVTDRIETVVTQGQSIPGSISPSFRVNPLNGTFQLSLDSLVVNGTVTSDTSTFQTQITWGPITGTGPGGGWLLTGPLPTTVGPISGTASFQAAPADNSGFTVPGGVVNWTLTWNFTPAQPNFDLIVSMPAYATWRPTAGKTEKDTGIDPATGQPNTLEIDTQLIDKSTGQTAHPDKLVFSLVEDSTEPGVALNWPPAGSATNGPDLTFDPAFNPFATVSPDGMTATLVPINGTPLVDTNAFLSPHDWGGWATLNVTATVNGQTVTGHLKDDSSTTNILIPKRQTGSNIADIWKTQHNVALSTPDDDDSELDPSGYPGCLGDGFTLYEEYRGFMENGKHIEGDPNAKDYFVENLIGADAEPGIFLFTELTGLNVHKDILKAETKIDHANGSAGSILINFNHAQGAHVTDQHGATIATQYTEPGSFRRMDGGLTILSEAGFHAKPRIVDGIAMQPRDAPGSLNPGNTHGSNISGGVITAVDALLQYDIGVAHELMHSVGVDHHGDGDTFEAFYFRAPDDPQNTTGRPSYFVYDSNQGQYVPVRIVPEQGGADPADTFWQKIQGGVTRCRAVVASPSQYPKILVDGCTYALQQLATNFQLLEVGSPHREHSGNDQCLMRYFFAQVYPAEAVSNTYYLVPAGTEPVGSMLCDAAVGTGVNDPNRTPQPRYFDASPGRGGCKFWVCVSDNKNYPLVPN